VTFEQALQASGLIPGVIVADGKWRRCKTTDKPKHRNGAYVLHVDGRGYFRNWATDHAVSAWSDESTQIRTPSAAEMAERERRKKQEREYRLRAIRGAREQWAQARSPRSLHPYLERKGLSAVGTNALRVHGDALIVPVFWRDRLMSIQSITPDGQKRFWTGAPVKGGAFVLDRPRAAVTAVCEGLATGLAIFQSLRMARVIVAFDAGNLVHAVDQLRPTGSVVICADNDHGTEAKRGTNPGREKAANAAELIGAGVAWPEGIEGTDWADALVEWGEGAHKRIERQIQAKARYVT
jgi:putative DNA primase/helicase